VSIGGTRGKRKLGEEEWWITKDAEIDAEA